MAYIVSARKYRPRTFEEVIGQEHVTSTLVNALLSDKLAHAFLFCGPRGVGKTTCARLLAKLINMPDPKKAAKDGSYADAEIDISLNIFELDAASNNSVEHIRALTDQVRFQPQQGKYKVFIIDEVHMLSQAAFNAFLKTLEEPPPYAIFILATTEKHKILPTILSRCQLYDFRRIQVPEIIYQLNLIAQKENIDVEEDALYTIAERADGAMRDALSIFDRIASASNKKVTYKDVVNNLNLLDFEYYFRMTNALLSQDSTAVLLILEEVLTNGFDGDIFINGLAKHLRNLLYCKQEKTLSIFQVSQKMKTQYAEQSRTIRFEDILSYLNIANHCDIHFPKAKDKRLHTEIALLKMCFASNKIAINQTVSTTPEKKTPQHSGKADTLVVNQDSKRHLPEIKKESFSIKNDESVKEVTDAPDVMDMVDSENQKQEVPGLKNKQIKSTLINTPSFGSIKDLLEEVKEEIESNNGAEIELTIKDVRQIWDSYGQNSASPTTKAIFEQAELDIKNQRIQIYVPTNIAKEEIQQEPNLHQELRSYFNQPDLIVEVMVDRVRFPDVEENMTKKLFTPKEKYDHLVKQNPLLAEMIETLKLKPDQDA